MINPPPRLLPMASHGCSCCGPDSHADTASIPAASDSSAGGSSSSYQVTGLTCGHCVKRVTQALQALPQVDDVQIDLAAGGVSTVTVTGVVPPEMVRWAIEEAGYTVLS
ncbi:heavy-metal-associated domain-containing protein [Corynebacterium lujinxingii]|uniref:Cation transporter n=1 Tax=Corynebacterium lujinxingii TaxID=2763010 RepID=A0A7H0K076_9CORY|nr:heavy-metal-associated domain-containing protein [Corynebacterium lujinxingii]MBC3179141.1 cation transporter [Corynebacterium lujinxingii]NNO11249.1 metal transporter [Corynebacterium lujinxingii]QNP90692.1 cation transporter [Corynebacterium lujinxingii]